MAGQQQVVAKPTLALVPEPPPFQRSCFTCSHWRGIEEGSVSWCEVYEEVIYSEAYEAEDCFTYEPVEEGSQPVLADDPRGEVDA